MQLNANFQIYASSIDEVAELVERLRGLSFEAGYGPSNAADILGAAVRQRIQPAPYGVAADAEDDDEQPTAGATQDAEPGEPKRRTRRTKAEMEAERQATAPTAAAPQATTASSAASDTPSSATSASTTSTESAATSDDDVVTDEVVGAVMKAALEKLKEQGKTAMDLRELLISATKHIIPEGASNRTALNTPELRAAAVAAMRTLL